MNSDTITVDLVSPIEHEGTTYPSLTFREANLGDLIAADKYVTPLEKAAAVMASVSGVPLAAIRKLSVRDVGAVMERAGAFLGNDLTADTGESSPG